MRPLAVAVAFAFALAPAALADDADPRPSTNGVERVYREGDVRAYSFVRELDDSDGDGNDNELVGYSTFVQTVNGDTVNVVASIDFIDGRTVIERATFHQGERLTQTRWSWEERAAKERQLLRRFTIDFASGRAAAFKREKPGTNGDDDGDDDDDDGKRVWTVQLDDTQGAFAGLGVVYAMRNLRSRLDDGETVEIYAVGFGPKPRKAKASLSRVGVENIEMGGREIKSAHYVIHVEIPRLFRVFVDPPDQHLWISTESPPALMRADVSLAEPSDPRIRMVPHL